MANKVKGDKVLRGKLAQLARDYPNAAVAALYQEAIGIFNESQEEVPVDSGRLRQSGLVTVVQRGDGYIVFVSYGTNYALRIHQDTSLDANRQDPTNQRDEYGDTRTRGKSKYLQDPFEAGLPGIGNRLVNRVKRMIESRRSPNPGSLPDVHGRNKG